MPTHEEARQWAEAYRIAWVSADPQAAAALFTEDATYRSNIYEEPHSHRSGIVQYWADVTSAQSEVDVRMGSPLVDGSKVTVEFWTAMKMEDEPITLAGCLLLDFDEAGLCTSLREYWNVVEGTQQPPAGWGH